MGIVQHIILLILIIVLIITNARDIVPSIRESSDIVRILSRNFFDILLMGVAIKLLLDYFNILRKNANYFKTALQFLNENEHYNDCNISCVVNKYIEIVDNDVMILLYSPYLILLSKCSKVQIVEPEIKPLFKRESYVLKLINGDGNVIQIPLPKLGNKDGSYQRLSDYLERVY